MSDQHSKAARVQRSNKSVRRRRGLGGALVLATTLGLLTAVASSCRTDDIPGAAASLGANLELAAGEVVLIDAGGAESKLLSGTPLPIGAKLRTGSGARALIRLGDGSRVFLADRTTVTLGDHLTLDSGQAWLEAPPLERGRQPTAHRLGSVKVAISGGGASLSISEGKANIYVAEGLAIVTTPGGRTELHSGERAIVEGEGAPEVEPVKFWEDWTGGMGDHSPSADSPWIGTGSLYAVDKSAPPGAPAMPLSIQRQTVEVAIDQQIAETEVDQVFFNPASNPVEGWYWFTVPEDAMLVGFALETDGELVEGEVVERKQATDTYEAAVAGRVDPALLEWIDARTVRARIFPIPGAGTRRVVVRYQQLLSESEGKLRYSYPMAAPVGREAATIEEFALEVQLRGKIAEDFVPATRSDARVEGREQDRVTMRRSGFTPRADFELELNRKHDAKSEEDEPPALRVNVAEPGPDQADYVMLRWLPEVKLAEVESPAGEVVIVVDTSASSDPSEHQTKLAVAEALLRSLSEGDHFALVGADLDAEVLYPSEGLAEATPEAISAALEGLAERGAGGATDLGGIFEQALERVHGLEQPAIIYIGDGVATSGEVDGEELAEHLQRSLAGSRARLFTVGVGREVDEALLTTLARVGGGKSLRVDDPGEAVLDALELSGLLKTPTITDVVVDYGQGFDDVFASAEGKLPLGEELRIFARTHNDLPETITVSWRFAGQDYSESYEVQRSRDELVLDRLVPRLWARAYVDALLSDSRGPEAVKGKVLSLGIDYGLMTPFTSFLALESERAYSRAGIDRRQRDFPVLTADASWSRASESAEPRESPTVLSMFVAAASAPWGCQMDPPQHGSAPEPSSSGHSQSGGQIGGGEARIRKPPPSAATPTDSRLEPSSYAEPADVPGGGRAQDGQGLARQSGSLGVLKLDAGERAWANEADRQAKRAERLAAAGFTAPPPPAWVEEVTESELARGAMTGLNPVIDPNIPRDQSVACSAASTRSLGHRMLLWQRRLDRQVSMPGMIQLYEASLAACEIRRWRDQRLFLELLQLRARTEGEIRTLLGHFMADPDAKTFLVQALQQRLIDPKLIAAVNFAVFGDVRSWWEIDRTLDTTDDPDERLRILDAALANAPGDPDGERRMIAELVQQDRVDEAIARGLRLRDQGQMNAELAQIVGELLARRGREDEARRLFSELVEFAPRSVHSRRLLGDIFLRHGWFADAYRQYELLMELAETPESAIRQARAAAGDGRSAEALQLLGRVAAGEGRAGEDDPRRWARLHSAAILAGLLMAPDLDVPKDKLVAKLESLSLFEGPATWELLVWDDLGVDLTLATAGERGLAADGVDASSTGLFARQYTGKPPELLVRHAGLVPNREVAWRRITLRFDGAEFDVSEQEGRIAAKVARAEAPEAEAPEPDGPE